MKIDSQWEQQYFAFISYQNGHGLAPVVYCSAFIAFFFFSSLFNHFIVVIFILLTTAAFSTYTLSEKRYKSCHWGGTFSKHTLLYILHTKYVHFWFWYIPSRYQYGPTKVYLLKSYHHSDNFCTFLSECTIPHSIWICILYHAGLYIMQKLCNCMCTFLMTNMSVH